MRRPGAPRKAVGLLNSTVGHKDRAVDVRSIQAIAHKRGYELLPDVLLIDDETYMPITFIAYEACKRDVDAVIAPSAHHFGEQGEKLAHAVTLETLGGTVPRVGWDATQ